MGTTKTEQTKSSKLDRKLQIFEAKCYLEKDLAQQAHPWYTFPANCIEVQS